MCGSCTIYQVTGNVTSYRVLYTDINGDVTLWFDNSIRSDVTGDLVYSPPAMCHIALLRTKVSCPLSAKIQPKCKPFKGPAYHITFYGSTSVGGGGRITEKIIN